jgi:hypothetical protein
MGTLFSDELSALFGPIRRNIWLSHVLAGIYPGEILEKSLSHYMALKNLT